MTRVVTALVTLGVLAGAGRQKPAGIIGTWRVDAKTEVKSGPREVIIRADSSASWGKEIARWRLKGNHIAIALGGEWEEYTLKLRETTLTLSGGDLRRAITLQRIGPATPLPAGVAVPPDPDSAGD